MKRFIYDAILIVLLVLIGLSLDDSTPLMNKQDELNTFEKEVKQGEEVTSKTGKAVINQIHDNKASALAKNTSHLIGSIIEGSVRFVSDVFENIVKEP